MNERDAEAIEGEIIDWVKSFIVGLNICPFAKHVVKENSLEVSVFPSNKLESALHVLLSEIKRLEDNPEIETSLLVYPNMFQSFFDYLDFVAIAESLMQEQGYEGIYQLATFHPEYCFADAETDDVANYTNRSPYPMLHLLRESSIDKAIEFYGDTSEIPEKNIALMHSLGLAEIKKITKKS